MDRLRPWALWLALLAVLLAVAVCVGSSLLTDPPPLAERVAALQRTPPPDGVDPDDVAELDAGAFSPEVADPPGLGLPALALTNGLLLVTVGLAALPSLAGNRVTGSVQGGVSIVAGLAAVVLGVLTALAALAALLVMVGLLLSTPFGTLAYLALFGSFDTGTSVAALGLVLALQVAAAVGLVVAQQRFLRSTGLVALVLTALVLTVVTTLLHTVVPSVLVSISDAIAAIVAGVVAALWGVATLVGGVVSVVKLVVALRQGGGSRTSRAAGPSQAVGTG